MGGRGSGSPATKVDQGPPATVGQREAQQINITIVDKPTRGQWRIIGDAPESVVGQSGLLVSRADTGGGYVVRNSGTDEVLARGRSIATALQALASNTGLRVNYVDETAGGRTVGTFG